MRVWVEPRCQAGSTRVEAAELAAEKAGSVALLSRRPDGGLELPGGNPHVCAAPGDGQEPRVVAEHLLWCHCSQRDFKLVFILITCN